MIGAEAVRQPEVRAVYRQMVADELALLTTLLADCLRERGRDTRAAGTLAAGLAAMIEGAYQLSSAAADVMPRGYARRRRDRLRRTGHRRRARAPDARIRAWPRPHIADLIALAIRLVNANQPERARIVCEQAVAAWPPHPAVHQLLAVLDLQAGQPATRARARGAEPASCGPTTCRRCWCWATPRWRSATCAAASQALERAVGARARPGRGVVQGGAGAPGPARPRRRHRRAGARAGGEARARRRAGQPRHRAAGARPASTTPCARTGARTACARRRSGASRTRSRRPTSAGCGWIWTTCAPSCAPPAPRAAAQRPCSGNRPRPTAAWPGGGGGATSLIDVDRRAARLAERGGLRHRLRRSSATRALTSLLCTTVMNAPSPMGETLDERRRSRRAAQHAR